MIENIETKSNIFLKVIAGATSYHQDNPQNQVSNVVKLRFPVDYHNQVDGHKTKFGSDIVILVLGKAIRLDSCSIRPIKLPPLNYKPIGHEKII